ENVSSADSAHPTARRYHGSGIVSNGTDDLSLNVKIASGMTAGKTAFYDRFDLYTTEDESVRSGYSARELIARNYAIMNAEIRFRIFNTIVPPQFSLRCTGFLFTDQAYLSSRRNDMFDKSIKDAYGAGVRLLFDNPVFAYFSFSYGFNRRKEGRYVFAGTAGF
ncbi:MAG TPA: hypothetical protein VF857_04510, partial [Spirochaetota bacterium]